MSERKKERMKITMRRKKVSRGQKVKVMRVNKKQVLR